MRELVTSFYGNEMVYALILAFWLFWVAAGSFLFDRLPSKIPAEAVVRACFLMLGILLPLTIISARLCKVFLHIPTGQIVGILLVAGMTFVLLAPFCLLSGGIYALLCRAADRKKSGQRASVRIGSLYQLEALGSALGGIVFSFVLIRFVPSLHTAVLLTLCALVFSFSIGARRGRGSLLFILAVSIFFFLYPGIDQLDHAVRKRQWRGLKIVEVKESIYGNLTLARDKENYHLFENGLLSFSTRSQMHSEEIVHLTLQGMPASRVLLIGNGLGGALAELLKYPGLSVDHLELDPAVIGLSKTHLPGRVLSVLADKRVRTVHMDARLFVKRAQGRYDAVILELGDPSSALINRYYTQEFYTEVSRIMNKEGVLSFAVGSSANYLNEENKDFLRTLNSTLKSVFADVRSVPGDSHIFLAAQETRTISLDHEKISAGLKKMEIQTSYFHLDLPSRMNAFRLWQINKVLGQKGRVNQDLRPVAYLYDILLWSTHFNTLLRKGFVYLKEMTLTHLLVVPLLVLGAGLIMTRKRRLWVVDLSIMTTGFSEIVFQILVILAFQSLYGYVYYRIGLIIASFMAGLVLGCILARRVICRCPKKIDGYYKLAQSGICLYPLILPVVFSLFAGFNHSYLLTRIFAFVFTLLPIVAGFIGGFQYPLAVELKARAVTNGKKPAGLQAAALYAMDVLGASLGALVTASILIPLLGVTEVALFCSSLNAAVLILLFRRRTPLSP